ncbi:MAG: TIGR04282 family arsenosugar biosynthesis glycosyltransferase [Promethearchaeota archaeon]
MKKTFEGCVLFFVKFPEEGKVKSRLAAEIGDSLAVRLYRQFVLDLMSKLKTINYPVFICFSPTNSLQGFKRWLGEDNLYLPQIGENLGQKMKQAFITVFTEQFKRAILIGSDSPDLPINLINEALEALRSYHTVIGPCFDGGYYLIGFTQENFLPTIFEGINWSTETVLQESIEILKENDLTIHCLPEWADVDTFSDLVEFYQRNQNTEFRSSKTMALLRKVLKT